jgi:hypothetical protein
MSEEKIDGLEEIEVENTPIDDLETEDVNLMFLGIDVSGSMQDYVNVMKDELKKFKQSIIDSKEADKILVARADFSDFLKIRGYKKIESFDVDYNTFDTTQMYDTIIDGSEKLLEYMDHLKKNGMRVKAVFAIFSDGMDNASKNNCTTARQVVDKLNSLEIVTAFICFGDEALQEAEDLCFKNVLKAGRTESELRKAFNQLSQSLISSSKSVVAKTDDFFEM